MQPPKLEDFEGTEKEKRAAKQLQFFITALQDVYQEQNEDPTTNPKFWGEMWFHSNEVTRSIMDFVKMNKKEIKKPKLHLPPNCS